MDVDTGLRSTRAEEFLLSLPKLDFAHMRTRYEEITVWIAFREELSCACSIIGFPRNDKRLSGLEWSGRLL